MAETIRVLDPRAAGGKRLKDKVSIITGSGQGIGRATARRFAEEGAIVMIAERYPDTAQRTCDELRAYGTQAETFVADVSSAENAKALMAATKDRFGRIDVLVNVAGGSMYGPKYGWEYTEEELQANVQNNFWTTMHCCWAVLPYMVEQQSGAIVNVGSNAPKGTMRLPYAAAKGGVFAITTSLALETATMGIRINCVAPFLSGTADPDDRVYTRIPGVKASGDPEQRARQAAELEAQRQAERAAPLAPRER